MKRYSEKLARFIQRHPLWFIIISVVISAASIPGITMLKTETGFSALVSPEAKISLDNARYQEQFGGESIYILLTGKSDDIFLPENLAVLGNLEQQITANPVYRSVSSPLAILRIAVTEAQNAAKTFHQQVLLAQEQAAAQARTQAAAAGLNELQQEQAAEQARTEVLANLQPRIDMLAQMGEPSLDNPLFINTVLYDETGEINATVRQFIPDNKHVLVSVTPEGNMTDAESLEATRNIVNLLSEIKFTNMEASVVSSAELIDAISVSMTRNFTILLGLSIVAMIIILFALFRIRWRLLSLLMVGISALWTFGLMGYLSVPLTMTSIAVLPILLGLGIDFSIQFHNRYQEELTRSSSVNEAMFTSISRMFPVVGIALIATIIGFVTLFISEIPMIRNFGLMLAVGIAISYIVGLFLLHSVVVLADKNVPVKRLQTAASKASGPIEKVLLRLGKLAINHTLWIFIISILFAIGGGVADDLLPTTTDYEQLMPQDNQNLMELRELRNIVGAGGSIPFTVEAEDITSPEVLSWMKSFQEEIVSTYPDIISASSPASIISKASDGIIPSEQEISIILANTPDIYLNQVISDDHTMARMAFTIKYISFGQVHDLIENIRKDATPPDGVRVTPVGSMVLSARIMDSVIFSRGRMNLICLAAIFIILLLVYRRLDKTLFAVIPTGTVIAWSSLDMYLIGIPLNPLTAILGVISIGICTEFMVLLIGRYDEEKGNGMLPAEAMVTAISRIGRAILTTAATTLGGFGVLIASNFVMVRDFGIVTLLGVFLCLLISITVMPGIIVWYDNMRLRRLKRKGA